MFSSGPFSRVAFFHTRDGLRTFTHRSRQVAPTGSLVNVLTGNDDPRFSRFNDVFIDTAFLQLRRT